MMEERKMEMELERVDIMKAIEAFNEKAELLGIKKIPYGSINNSNVTTNASVNPLAERLNNVVEIKYSEWVVTLEEELRKLGFEVEHKQKLGKHPTEDVYFKITREYKYGKTYFSLSFY